MMSLLEPFHFLRPLWLLLLLPAVLLAIALYRSASGSANWRRAIAAGLIEHLLEPVREGPRRWVWLLAVGWTAATLALAGPTWERSPQPVLQKRDALVIVLDLSLSMYAEDIKPSRLQRARYKILDILKQRREGLTALIVYSGAAHVVAPLTDDTATVANLVPALAPAMMPSHGSNAAAAVEMATQLLRGSGFERGRVLLLSDDIDAGNADRIAEAIGSGGWQLSILGIGTEAGAPIPTRDGFLRGADGATAIARMPREHFTALAQQTGARYSDIQVDDRDIDALLPDQVAVADTRTVQRDFDQWRERGPLLVMALLPLAALVFRRGWLLVLPLLILSPPSQALEWRDLWQRPDQQAQRLFAEGESKQAAGKFTDPAWRGAAQYRSGDYAEAAQTLSALQSADAHYNRGNALAQAGKLSEAIAAYDAALKIDPAAQDAKFNRELVQKLAQQQSGQEQKSGDKGSGQDQQSADSSADQSADGQTQKGQQPSTKDSGESGSQGDTTSQPPSQASDDPSQQSDSSRAGTDAATENNAADKEANRKQTEAAAENNREPDSQAEAGSASAAQPRDGDKTSAAQQTQQRATERWLQQIPDDPAGLLQRKFLYEYRQRQRAGTEEPEQPAW